MEQSIKFSVQMLLTTHNGERFLREFLDSLHSQLGVINELMVSDDTLRIFEDNKAKFAKYKILVGPGHGPMANFLFLAQHTDEDFVAFADQDDLWDENHLRNSCLRIKNFGNILPLTFSSVGEFSTFSSNNRIWPRFKEIPGIEQFFAQNFARGCTIVFNHELLCGLRKYQPRHAIMHDWLILLISYSKGEVVYSDSPEVHYRVHEDIFTRFKHQNKVLRILYSSKRKWEPHLRLREFKLTCVYKMNKNSRLLILNFVNGCSGSFLTRLIYALNFNNNLRDDRFDDVFVRARILFQPFLKVYSR